MMLAVQDYDFKVKYMPGKDFGLADALSRLPNPENTSDVKMDVRIEHVQFKADKIQSIKDSTQSDPAMSELKEVIYTGWPETLKELPQKFRQFWSYRDEFSVDNGLILKGDRVYIPKPHRQCILENLHTGHLGIIKTQLRARKDVYWPKINEDIENPCNQCAISQDHQRTQTNEPLEQFDIPSRPWSVIGTDLFQIDNDQYLMTVDYYTKFPLVDKLAKPAMSETAVSILKDHCSIMGIPDVIRSGNGPHCSSQIFTKFTSEWGIKHISGPGEKCYEKGQGGQRGCEAGTLATADYTNQLQTAKSSRNVVSKEGKRHFVF